MRVPLAPHLSQFAVVGILDFDFLIGVEWYLIM